MVDVQRQQIAARPRPDQQEPVDGLGEQIERREKAALNGGVDPLLAHRRIDVRQIDEFERSARIRFAVLNRHARTLDKAHPNGRVRIGHRGECLLQPLDVDLSVEFEKQRIVIGGIVRRVFPLQPHCHLAVRERQCFIDSLEHAAFLKFA